MAPKKNKDTLIDPAAGLTEEQQAALQISQRLQAAAKSHGVSIARCCVSHVIRSCPSRKSPSAGADWRTKSDISRAANTQT